MIWQIVIYKEFGLLQTNWKNKTFFYFMGNSNSSEVEEVENQDKKKKSIKRRISKKSKSLKRKNKINKDDYDNTHQGTHQEFFY